MGRLDRILGQLALVLCCTTTMADRSVQRTQKYSPLDATDSRAQHTSIYISINSETPNLSATTCGPQWGTAGMRFAGGGITSRYQTKVVISFWVHLAAGRHDGKVPGTCHQQRG